MGKINLEVKDLVKKYGGFTAVNKLSFFINEGEIYALLGPNGAGKTSTFESIEGVITYTSGNILINGIEKKKGNKIDHNMGIQLQDTSYPPNMKVIEMIKLVSLYYNCKINKKVYEQLQMSELKKKKLGDLSVGQRRRVSLYLAIIHNPKLIILDEPTAGLDVISKKEIYNILNELKQAGASILISSHDMNEIEKLADRIGVIVNGKLLSESSALEMTSKNQETKKVILKTKMRANIYLELLEPYIVRRDLEKEGYIIIYVTELQKCLTVLMKQIDNNQDTILDLRVEQPSLEEVFIKMTDNKESI